MALSLNKLVQLLESQGFIPTQYFRFENACILIEIISLLSGAICMLYIPSRFSVPIDPGDNVVEIVLVDPEEEDTGGNKSYSNIDINKGATSPELFKDRPIELNSDISTISTLNGIIKQLERIQYCVKNLDYDLVVSQDAYIGYIRDGECDCYRRREPKTIPRTLRVVVTLPIFFEQGSKVDRDTLLIYDGIRSAIEMSAAKSSAYMDRILKATVTNGTSYATRKLVEKMKSLEILLARYREILDTIERFQSKIQAKTTKEVESLPTGLQGDLFGVHLKDQGTRKIRECFDVKKLVLDEMSALRKELDALTLPMERVLFENASILEKFERNLLEFPQLFD